METVPAYCSAYCFMADHKAYRTLQRIQSGCIHCKQFWDLNCFVVDIQVLWILYTFQPDNSDKTFEGVDGVYWNKAAVVHCKSYFARISSSHAIPYQYQSQDDAIGSMPIFFNLVGLPVDVDCGTHQNLPCSGSK